MRTTKLSIVACLNAGLLSTAHAQPPGHGVHPVMPDAKLFLHVRLLDAEDAAFTDVPLPIRSPSVAENLDKVIAGPAGTTLRARRYLSSAELEQNVAPDEAAAAPPAVELAIEGRSQAFRRWLLADDPERNRLISYIATWRYMAVKDAAERDLLFKQFEEELTREPAIRIRAAAGENWEERALLVGRAQTFAALGVTLTVREFFPDYAMDRTTLTPTNQSPLKKNPAALIEIEHLGVKESRWVFAKFPDFAHAGKRMPFEIVLDCPLETEGNVPDLAVVTVGRSRHESWVRSKGKAAASPLEIETKVGVPGSQYTFKLTRFVPSAHMAETYVTATHGKGKPAVEIEYADKNGTPARTWLGLGHFRRITTQKGATLIGFDDRPGTPSGAHP